MVHVSHARHRIRSLIQLRYMAMVDEPARPTYANPSLYSVCLQMCKDALNGNEFVSVSNYLRVVGRFVQMHVFSTADQ